VTPHEDAIRTRAAGDRCHSPRAGAAARAAAPRHPLPSSTRTPSPPTNGISQRSWNASRPTHGRLAFEQAPGEVLADLRPGGERGHPGRAAPERRRGSGNLWRANTRLTSTSTAACISSSRRRAEPRFSAAARVTDRANRPRPRPRKRDGQRRTIARCSHRTCGAGAAGDTGADACPDVLVYLATRGPRRNLVS
jgi:hypothetical protein